MDPARFTRIDETTWQIEPTGPMRVPGIIYGDEALIRDMDDKVYEQTANVATLPGIVKACYVCQTPIGDMASRSAAWPLSTPMKVMLSLPAASVSTFRAACERC